MRGKGPVPPGTLLRIAGAMLLAAAAATAAPAQEEEATPFRKQAALFAQHCAKCHTVGLGDRVGPDLKGVADRRPREWLVSFVAAPSRLLGSDPVAMELLAKFNDVPMPDLGLAPDQVEGLLDYVKAVGEGTAGGVPEPVPLREDAPRLKVAVPDEGRGVLPAAAAVFVLLLAAAAAAWRRGCPRTSQVLVVLAAGAGYWGFGGRAHHRLPADDQGYEPVQPIAYSHRLHAGDLEIACLYCHHGAEKGPVAGIPTVAVCMNCHNLVRKNRDQAEPSPEIARLVEAWESRNSSRPQPVAWVRVHRLPDFVAFDHSAHVRNGLVCQECHGPVETMDRVRQASDLSMGWCVNCHRHPDRQAPTHWKRAAGPLDCGACHR